MRINCPRHDDKVASCYVYQNGAFCFGGCGFIPASEVKGSQSPVSPNKERYVEDLTKKLAYIGTLPVELFRGFPLPTDSFGHYIVWPDLSYYKLRVKDKDAKSKYRGPAGHKATLFWARQGTSDTLCIVEGEFEALSVAAAFPEWDVCSPGGVSQFTQKSNLTHWIKYHTIIIATDDDKPGREAAIKAQGMLLNKVPELYPILKSVEKDFNDIYCEYGHKVLRETVEGCLSHLRATASGKQV